jgi:uncharacterized C2H2 Zn-finger protein
MDSLHLSGAVWRKDKDYYNHVEARNLWLREGRAGCGD